MEFTDYIKPELLILIPVLYILGLILKRCALNDKFIPLVIGGISIILCAVWTFATCEIIDYHCVLNAIFAAVTQGVLCAGASVYANQIYKQLINKKGER